MQHVQHIRTAYSAQRLQTKGGDASCTTSTYPHVPTTPMESSRYGLSDPWARKHRFSLREVPFDLRDCHEVHWG